MKKLLLLSLLLTSVLHPPLAAQEMEGWQWMEHADTLYKKRFWGALGAGTLIYSGASVGLYHAWYKDYELTKFRTFNDSKEWLQMDKTGHWLTTYTEARLLYDGTRWTGLDKRRSLWLAGAAAMFLQGTVEVMDGFSAEWGFSWSDIGFNALGMGLFVVQQSAWDEQRIIPKISTNRALPDPSIEVTSTSGASTYNLRQRHIDLYGRSLPERFLKDYNTMTIWASVNIHAFAPQSRWPRWLNVAAGYGADNLYGGFHNHWRDGEETYVLPVDAYPRTRQFYLSLDVDLKRIPTRKRWLQSVLSIVNFIKIPAPTLAWDTHRGWKLHPVYF
ncbi:MAG: DUF2279 domain-containing protein [Saprospiraceae bacterium]